MKLNKEFLLHNIGEETVLVPTGKADFSGIVRGNKTLGAVLQLLKTDTTEQEIVKAMCEQFDAPQSVIEKDVRRVIEELTGIGALDA